MKTFEGEQDESAGDAGLDWEQVMVDEGGGDALSGFSVGQNYSSGHSGAYQELYWKPQMGFCCNSPGWKL